MMFSFWALKRRWNGQGYWNVQRVQDMGLSPDTMLYNAIKLGLCKNWRTNLAIDFLAYMVSNEEPSSFSSKALLMRVLFG